MTLLECYNACSLLVVGGYEIDNHDDSHGVLTVELTDGENTTFKIPDQEVVLDELGTCEVKDSEGEELSVQFMVSRPLTVEDVGY